MHRVEVSYLCAETVLLVVDLSESVRALLDLRVTADEPHAHLLLELRDDLLEVSLDSDDLTLLAQQRVLKVFVEEFLKVV